MYLARKGDVNDGIVFIVTLFFLAVAFIAAAFINSKFSDIVSDTALNQSSAAPGIVQAIDNLSEHGIQRAFVFLFAFLIIAMMMTSFMVRVHPAWFFLYIIFLGIAVLLSAILSNVYNAMIYDNALSEVAAQQTQINWIMQHSVKIVIGAVALSLIILFAKPPQRGDI